MKKTTVLLTIFLALTVAGSAQSYNDSGLENFKEAYNNQSSQVPGFIGNIIGGEDVEINLKSGNETETIGAKFDGVEIEKISEDGLENPTMQVNVSENAIQSVVSSDKPYQELQNQLEAEEISYETTSTIAGIKLKIFETLGSLASMIGLSF